MLQKTAQTLNYLQKCGKLLTKNGSLFITKSPGDNSSGLLSIQVNSLIKKHRITQHQLPVLPEIAEHNIISDIHY